jgi:hypothetical protein
MRCPGDAVLKIASNLPAGKVGIPTWEKYVGGAVAGLGIIGIGGLTAKEATDDDDD